MYSNSFGNNIIVQTTSGALKYYVMSTNGVAGSAVTIESSGVAHANITGDGNKAYLVYKKSDRIKVKYSTNAGTSWSPLNDLVISPSGLDAVFYDGLFHITYSESNIAKYYQHNGSYWTKYQPVSLTEIGTNPRIEILEDDNKVYVAYDNGENCKSREYNVVTNSWGSIQTLFTSLSDANLAGFGVDANYIYLYYYRWEVDPIFGGGFSLFENKIQKSNYSTVSSLRYFRTEVFFTNSTTTYDEKVHTAFQWIDALGKYEAPDAGLNIATFDDGTRSFQTVYATYDPLNHVDISSTHNDLHVIWKIPSSSYLKYRQYDTTPSTPENLTLTDYNTHPRLQWTKNKDADISSYVIYRKIGPGSWNYLATTTATTYDDPTIKIYTGQMAGSTIYYRITAKDHSDNESDYSGTVSCRIKGAHWDKKANSNSETIDSYALDQNYPNPFNPATSIKYRVKEKGFVSLKVYNMLGKEVADLVNEAKDIGHHSVNFNASELPSGIYIYSIRVNDFSQSRKMLVLK